ncbi:MAG: hypothetical protein WKF81_09875 [Thermomicrobiales bacterium]
MYLQSFEVEHLSRSPRNERLDQQFAELALMGKHRPTGVTRIRIRLSNLLFSIATSLRPTDAARQDMVSAR